MLSIIQRVKKNDFSLISFQDKIIKTGLKNNITNLSFKRWQNHLIKNGFTGEQAIDIIHDAFDIAELEKIIQRGSLI